MVDVSMADEQQLAELKAWFFKESIRLNEEKEALAREREQIDRERERMDRENRLFEKKLEVLKKELYKLANEKKAFEQEKLQFRYMKEKARAEYAASGSRNNTGVFFRGVASELALKKRYKDLLKIYHPDNLNGDTDTVQCINREFDSLKKRYCS